MNCLEFRRQKLQDPRRLTDDTSAHVSVCSACHSFAQEIDETDRGFLLTTLSDIPPGLEERILLRRKSSTWLRAQRLALAASVLLMAGLAYTFWAGLLHANYAQLAIQHVSDEPDSFISKRNDDTEFFRKAVSDFGGRVNGPLGKVRYMKLCPENGAAGWHIVLETKYGLATLILIPGKSFPGESVANDAGLHALARAAGRGYYAVVTSTPETTAAVQTLLQEQIAWQG